MSESVKIEQVPEGIRITPLKWVTLRDPHAIPVAPRPAPKWHQLRDPFYAAGYLMGVLKSLK
jgi:hypothetical protein